MFQELEVHAVVNFYRSRLNKQRRNIQILVPSESKLLLSLFVRLYLSETLSEYIIHITILIYNLYNRYFLLPFFLRSIFNFYFILHLLVSASTENIRFFTFSSCLTMGFENLESRKRSQNFETRSTHFML